MPDLKEARRRHASHYKEALCFADQLYTQGGELVQQGLTIFDREWANIQLGFSWAAALANSDSSADELCSTYASAGASLLSLRRHPQQRLLWFTNAIEAARRLHDREAEGRHLGNWGLRMATWATQVVRLSAMKSSCASPAR